MKRTIILCVILLGIFFIFTFSRKTESSFENSQGLRKNIILADGNSFFKINTRANSVSEFLKEQSLIITEYDEIFPEKEARIFSGSKIIIERARWGSILIDDQKIDFYTHQENVGNVLLEQSLGIKDEDLVSPKRDEFVYSGIKIEVTRVEIKSEIAQKSVKYKTITEEDGKLSWRKKKIKQKGKNGTKEIKYEVVYYDGEEISRKVVGEKIIEEPTDEIIVQGTYIKFGKTHQGLASWYAHTGTLSAANPWLPLGSYVKVTNRANGKSVIVRINDRGPFGAGRIIDLDKEAFSRIALLGEGVLDVKMEEILN